MRSAPPLDGRSALRPQIERAIHVHQPDLYQHLTHQTFAAPGRALQTLQTLMYNMINLDAPARTPTVRRVPAPISTRPAVSATEVISKVDLGTRTVDVQRFPVGEAAVSRAGHDQGDRHLAVDITETDPTLLQSADVLIRGPVSQNYPAREWARSTLATYPGCRATAIITPSGACRAFPRHGPTVSLRFQTSPDQTDAPDPAILASAVYAWIVANGTLETMSGEILIQTGSRRTAVRCNPQSRT
jgi:hypothetical protein